MLLVQGGLITQVESTKQSLDYPIGAGNYVSIAFVSWWLKITPMKILYIGNKTAIKEFNFFSIDLLFKTLFLPWKRDEIDMSNLSLQDRFRILIMNLVSRLVGAVVRGGTIMIGLFAIALIYILTIILLLGFILLPVISIYLIISGIIG